MRPTILSKVTTPVVAGFVLLSFVCAAQAFPTRGGGRANCMACHGTPRNAAEAPGMVFAAPGDLVSLMIDVTDGSDAYSMSLAGLGASGLAGFAPDASWANHFSPGTFNTDPQYGGPFYALTDSSVEWTGPGPVAHAFNLLLASSTAPGSYDLTFTVSGSGAEGLWRDSNAFPLTVVRPGDINRDGAVNRLDVALFVPHLGTRSGASWTTGDFNSDDATTLADLALLQSNFGAGAPTALAAANAVPEPSALALVALALAALCLRALRSRWKRTVA